MGASFDLAAYGLAIFLAYGVAVFAVRRWKLRAYPGPFSLPVLGNLWDPSAPMLITYLKRQVRRHGKFFTFWPGMNPFLVVLDGAAVREVLSDTRTFVKGTDYSEKFSEVFGEGLITSSGETHKTDRACLGRYFIKTSIDAQLPMICAETLRMMKEEVDPHVGKAHNMESFFHFLALRIFGKLSLSHDYGLPEHQAGAVQLNEVVKFGSNVIGEHIGLNLPMWGVFPRLRKLRKDVKWVDSHFDEIIDARLDAMHRGEAVPDDMLAAMLAEHTPRDKLHEQLRTLLSAGHDTTAFFSCYMTYLLAQHPGVQDKVKEEVARVLQGREAVTAADVAELKYCRMVMQETLRLFTVIPVVNRTASVDHTFKESGKVVPAGTTVLLPLGIMNRDEEVWPEPNAFKPERFEEIAGHTSAKHGYLPFGYGSRTCIGNTLALTEGAVMLALLMQKYRLFPDPNFKLDVIAGISLVSKNGVSVRVEAEERGAVPSNGQP